MLVIQFGYIIATATWNHSFPTRVTEEFRQLSPTLERYYHFKNYVSDVDVVKDIKNKQ